MMVSFIQSNYMGFGSGAVEPTFGISLQNRGHGFNLSTGPGRNTANLVAPGKRPFHTIIPAFLTKDGQPVMSYGVMGAKDPAGTAAANRVYPHVGNFDSDHGGVVDNVPICALASDPGETLVLLTRRYPRLPEIPGRQNAKLVAEPARRAAGIHHSNDCRKVERIVL